MQEHSFETKSICRNTSWPSSFLSISVSTIFGYTFDKNIGAAIGAGTTILDETLINNCLENSHNFSNYFFWWNVFYPLSTTILRVALVILSPNSSILLKSSISSGVLSLFGAGIAILPTIILSSFADDNFDFSNRIESQIDSLLIANKIFNLKNTSQDLPSQEEDVFSSVWNFPVVAKEKIIETYNNEFLFLFGIDLTANIVAIIVESAFLKYAKDYSGNLFSQTFINKTDKSLYLPNSHLSIKSTVFVTGMMVVGAYMLKNFFDFGFGLLDSWTKRKLSVFCLEKGSEIIFDKIDSRKILSKQEGREIMDLFLEDLIRVSGHAFQLIDFSRNTTKSFNALNNLQKLAPDVFGVYALLLPIEQYALKTLANNSFFYLKEQSSLSMKNRMLLSDISTNIDEINLRDGNEYSKDRYKQTTKEFYKAEQEIDIIKNYQELFRRGFLYLKSFLDIFVFPTKVFLLNQTPIPDVTVVKLSTDNLYQFLLGDSSTLMRSVELMVSKHRLTHALELIQTPSNSQIVFSLNLEKKIVFSNYDLFLYNKLIVHIDYLEFSSGKIYAFTGKSGCGKTSALMDATMGLFGVMHGKGNVSRPFIENNPKEIMFIPQSKYNPSCDIYLIESILFPRKLTDLNSQELEKTVQKIKLLFKELEIDSSTQNPEIKEGLSSKLFSKSFKLSGGQKSKIAIIQIILNNPLVAKLDETLVGLDLKSLIKVQKAIKKHLQDSIILIVDHNAKENNYDSFYDQEIHFEKGEVVVQQIEPREIDLESLDEHSVGTQDYCACSALRGLEKPLSNHHTYTIEVLEDLGMCQIH
jgi:ABC-type multidrug transport system ATPase subunit